MATVGGCGRCQIIVVAVVVDVVAAVDFFLLKKGLAMFKTEKEVG